MASVFVDIAAEFTGKKAFKQAETSTDKLSKSVKSLGRTLGVTLSAAAVIAFGKASVKAAAADEKAQQQLALALRNVGLGRDAATSEAYIQRLQSEFGVVDDLLRPAYQTLAVATRDTAQAQKLLQLGLDISASTGRDLSSVTAALSKGYLGNTAALSKLGVGISKADLKARSFEEITDQLAVTFAGSATAAANTFQGSINKLGVATANVQEIIGTGLIDALKAVGKDNSVDDLAKNMESAALSVADFVRGLGQIAAFEAGGENKSLLGLLLTPFKRSLSAGPLGAITRLGEASRIAMSELNYTAAASATAFEKGFGVYAKFVKVAKVLTAEEIKQLKARQLKAALDKANLALGKASTVFDIEKIQLAAAEQNQAKQLANITSQAQALQITNDLARLRVKQSILALDEAIASGDVKAITAATARLNADLGILGTLNNQALKLADIKSILMSIAPKDLINLDNLRQALGLLGQIASMGSAGAVSSTSSAPIMPSSLNPRPMGSGYLQAPRGFTNQELQYFEDRESYQYRDVFPTAPSSGSPINITVQAGVGDPNAIAEAIDQLLIDALQRGTLRGTYQTL